MPRSADTDLASEKLQLELYRRMTPERRVAIGLQMCRDARVTLLAGIQVRHPEYDEPTARWALFRLLVGDELFVRAWPHAPLVAP